MTSQHINHTLIIMTCNCSNHTVYVHSHFHHFGLQQFERDGLFLIEHQQCMLRWRLRNDLQDFSVQLLQTWQAQNLFSHLQINIQAINRGWKNCITFSQSNFTIILQAKFHLSILLLLILFEYRKNVEPLPPALNVLGFVMYNLVKIS